LSSKLIIDADPGIGDALAVALALVDPDLDVICLSPTAGRVSGPQATHNLQSIASIIDPDRWPRIGDCERPLYPVPKDARFPLPSLLNGPEGLGECHLPSAPLHQRHDAQRLLSELVREAPNEVTLLTLGPLTNVTLAMECHPSFLQQLTALVCLGGSLGGGGDVTAAAEFNMFADAEAARTTLTYPATKTLVPLDVARSLMISFDQYQRWEFNTESGLGRILQQTVPFALRASRQHLGLEGVTLPELVALTAVVHPELLEREAMNVDVELSGELTRGATVFDRRRIGQWQTNIDVITGFDVQGVLDYVTRLIRAAA
jgi:inosine-uridine nucleoside N-ribohydrolase